MPPLSGPVISTRLGARPLDAFLKSKKLPTAAPPPNVFPLYDPCQMSFRFSIMGDPRGPRGSRDPSSGGGHSIERVHGGHRLAW